MQSMLVVLSNGHGGFIMAILKVDTISGIGTELSVFEGDIEFTSQNFLTLPKGDTTQRGRGRGFYWLDRWISLKSNQ